MRGVLSWMFHHFVLLAALLSIASLLGLVIGTGFYLGGTPWYRAIELSRYLGTSLILPTGMIWIVNVTREARRRAFRHF